ncbi:MAG: lytic transglycosylase domain-containing protein [Burkholderiaceae bacterium]
MTRFLKLLAHSVLFLTMAQGVARAGDTGAAASRGLIASAIQYEHAEGVPRDYEKAAALYCQAAKQGNAEAQFSLGWMYANGRGVVRSDAVAAQLFALAAKQGHAAAVGMLQFAPVASKTPDMPACLLPDPAKAAQAVITMSGTPAAYPKTPISKLVDRLAVKYNVDPLLVMAVIAVESGFNVNARSPKNAQGLMQLIPETAQRFQVKNALDAEDNIRGGIAYLKWLLSYFKGNVQMVAAAYNAGEKAVERYHGVPPYPETQDYVRKIARLYQKTDHPYQISTTASPAFAFGRPVRQ